MSTSSLSILNIDMHIPISTRIFSAVLSKPFSSSTAQPLALYLLPDGSLKSALEITETGIDKNLLGWVQHL